MMEKELNTNEIIENEELILLILYYSKGFYTFKTRLIKLLFVFDKIFPINDDLDLDLDFFPYNFGPMIDYDEYELLISTLKNYEIIEVEENKIEKYSTPIKKIKIREKNKEVLIQTIKKELILKKPEHKIELIEKICNLFPNNENTVLIQFVYYIREDFTERSKKKKEIFNLPKKTLQNKIISILKELRVRYVIIILEYVEEILKIFNISKTMSDYSRFKELLKTFQDGIKHNKLKITKEIIQKLDHFSLNDKKFHKLKLSLLDLFLKNLDCRWDNEIIISVLIYILKSLDLDWPLKNPSDRKNFISMTSQLYRNYISFYAPEDTFSILEKINPTEEEIQRFILNFEEDLTHKEEKEDYKKNIEYSLDFTEDDEFEDEIIKKVNL